MAWNKSSSDRDAAEASVPASSGSSRRPATVGPSITIQGTLSGEEDLLIEGKVEGEVSLRGNALSIGKDGRVKADVYAQSISVEGEVEGNLFGDDQIVIRQSGKVVGNVTAPRVSLEDGAKFRGAIDMEPGKKIKPASSISGQRDSGADRVDAGTASSGGKKTVASS